MELSRCEQVKANGEKCLKKAKSGCKLEKKVFCLDCMYDYHVGGDHKKISIQQVNALAHIEKELKNISKLKVLILESAREIIDSVIQAVKNIQISLLEKENLLARVMNGELQETPNFNSSSCRFNNMDDILNAINFHFSDNEPEPKFPAMPKKQMSKEKQVLEKLNLEINEIKIKLQEHKQQIKEGFFYNNLYKINFNFDISS